MSNLKSLKKKNGKYKREEYDDFLKKIHLERRLNKERRKFSYSYFIPERRSGKDRRADK